MLERIQTCSVLPLIIYSMFFHFYKIFWRLFGFKRPKRSNGQYSLWGAGGM